MPRRLFGSIEDRYGVNEPGYEPPQDEVVVLTDESKAVGPLEIVGSLLIPLAGLIFAVMRLADDEVGPGLACLLTGIIGWFCWAIAIVALA